MIERETSPALDAISNIGHGFFGRRGGMSTGDFAGLNVSWAVGDDQQIVERNRESVRQATAIGPLIVVRQVHSAAVETIHGAVAPSTLEADALVTATPGLALAILTADCTPILLADPDAGVVGAAHAGWRGAVDGIVGNTVAAMAALGADPANISAAYGPSISAPNYEVGDKFRSDFLALHPGGEHHFHTPPGGQPHFDLPGFVEARLRAAGITRVERVGACTYAHPDRYFSHRLATHRGTKTGRQIAVIGLTQV
ncbi:peptidoglycan editing factor PgeF [Devosia sp. YIM 151766]|uniref:peptidoglycan editing factor PgeF n=1 Tax=Devosia sp. YIM 151766 TaxID=3017325 RepID=UPI00255CC72B|nr:peptidoglycan editing factor PgeF [Devosia sp. YIM 151766]WIY51867.1 peptidoglycan editing factor PgeF [Devosia sp. YIM 151766]